MDDVFSLDAVKVAQLAQLNGYDFYRKPQYYIIVAEDMDGMCKNYPDNPYGYDKALTWMKKGRYKSLWKNLPEQGE